MKKGLFSQQRVITGCVLLNAALGLPAALAQTTDPWEMWLTAQTVYGSNNAAVLRQHSGDGARDKAQAKQRTVSDRNVIEQHWTESVDANGKKATRRRVAEVVVCRLQPLLGLSIV